MLFTEREIVLDIVNFQWKLKSRLHNFGRYDNILPTQR